MASLVSESLVSEAAPLVALPTPSATARPRRQRSQIGRVIVAAGDAVASVLAVLLVFVADPGLQQHLPPPLALLVAAPLVWSVCVGGLRGYEERLIHAWTDEIKCVVQASLGLTGVAIGAAAIGGMPVTPTGFLLLAGATAVGSLVPRAGVRTWRRVASGRSTVRRRVVVVGRPADVEPLVAEMLRTPTPGYEIVPTAPDGLKSALAEPTAAVVAIPSPELDPPMLRRLGWELERTGTELFVTAGLLDVHRTRAAVVAPGSVPLVHVRRAELTGVRRFVKDVAERLAAALALLVAAPILIAVMIAIRLDSTGPAMFKQTRVGRSGRPFTMLKFRTMTVGSDRMVDQLASKNEADAVLFKIKDDPRITRIGKFLRQFSIDEVPQLLNVVLGQMSLVGPRPPLPAEVVLYEDDVRRRFAVKPGVTGLWQVSGRSDLSWEDAVRLDLRYVDNWSLTSDLRIVIRTVRAVLKRDGAY